MPDQTQAELMREQGFEPDRSDVATLIREMDGRHYAASLSIGYAMMGEEHDDDY